MKFRNHRYATRFETTLNADRTDVPCLILSISENGAKVEIGRPLAAGQKVKVALPMLAAGATVVWCSGGYVGLKFDTMLTIATLDRVRFGVNTIGRRKHSSVRFSEMH